MFAYRIIDMVHYTGAGYGDNCSPVWINKFGTIRFKL